MNTEIVRFAAKLAGVAFAAGLLATGCAAPTAGTATDDATTPPANGVATPCVLADVALADAGTAPPPGAELAGGRTLAIFSSTTMYSLLGTTFGGDGLKTFKLPDLSAAAPEGKAYNICTDGVFPRDAQRIYDDPVSPSASSPTCSLGTIRLSATQSQVSRVIGYSFADGRLLPIAENRELFAVIGARFGGDGVTTFALPNDQATAPSGITAYVCTRVGGDIAP